MRPFFGEAFPGGTHDRVIAPIVQLTKVTAYRMAKINPVRMNQDNLSSSQRHDLFDGRCLQEIGEGFPGNDVQGASDAGAFQGLAGWQTLQPSALDLNRRERNIRDIARIF